MVLIHPDNWHDVVESIASTKAKNPKVVVIGPKDAGKSTFIRFAFEKLSDRFASLCRLEADCGQPDFSPPGVLNLAVRQSSPERTQIVSQRFLGFVNPSSNPMLYASVVSKVFEDYEREFSKSPLFVNCHGWDTGMGKTTWESVITLVQPDFVVHVDSDADTAQIDVFPSNPFLSASLPVPSPVWLPISRIIVLGEEEGKKKESASDRRWVKYASHFRPDLAFRNEFRASSPLDFYKYPYVKMLDLDVSSIILSFPCSDVALTARSVEATIVGLVNAESGQCICLGFVAAVDDAKMYTVIPPNIPLALGASISEIVRGDMNWSPRDQIFHLGKFTSVDFTDRPHGEPYFLTNVLVDDAAGAKSASTRTNLQRKRLRK